MSSMNIDAPGAYPTTPLNEEPMQQKHHNKLHKREDPRGWGSSLEQETQHSGHNLSGGSGIYAEGSSIGQSAHPTTSSSQAPSQQTQFSKQEPHSLDNEAHSSGHHFNNSSIYVDESSFHRESENHKPGVMTGAVSRIGTQDSPLAQDSNYTYGNKTASPPTYGGITNQYDNSDMKPATTATSGVTSTHSHSDSPNIDSNVHATSATSTDQDHNKVHSGLGGKSNVDHKEPYWGNIPFGAGVYNGVTGHGSNEPTSHQKSIRDHDNTAKSTGVYNSVTGHGSNESTTQQRSMVDQNTPAHTGVYNGVTGHGSNEADTHQKSVLNQNTTNDSSSHQRAFPLINDSDTAAANRAKSGDESKRESHFKEGLAGAGATAAGGYVAHEYANKHHSNAKAREDEPKESGGSKLHALLHPRSHEGKEAEHKYEDRVKPTAGVTSQAKNEEKLPHRSPVSSSTENQTDPKLERKLHNTSHDNTSKEGSNLGYYGAAAATTGAGAYGAHKYANRDSSKERSLEVENKHTPHATSHSVAGESTRHDVPLVGRDTMSQKTDRDQLGHQQYNTLSDGTPSGIASSVHRMSQTTDRKQPGHQQYNTLSDGTLSGIAGSGTKHSHDNTSSSPSHKTQFNDLSERVSTGTATNSKQDERRTSSDSSHGGQYNVLSSGTPSGINLENVHHSHRSSSPTAVTHQQQKQSTFLSNASPSSSRPSGTAAGASSDAHNCGRSQYDKKESANQGQALRDFEMTAQAAALSNPKETGQGSATKQSGGKVNPDFASGAGNEMSTGSSGPGRKVTHRCTKCGEENDITEYLKS